LKYILRLSILGVILFTSSISFGQNDDSTQKIDTTQKFIRNPNLFGLPLVFFTPETGWGGGVAGGFTFLLPNEPEDGRRSNVQLAFSYTERNQILVFLPFKTYWNKSVDQFYGELGYFDFSDLFYPVGNEHDEKVQESFEEEYRFTYPRIRLNYLRRVDKKNYVGLRWWFDDLSITETEEGGILDEGNLLGSDGGFVTGAGLLYQFDTRDDINYTKEGTFFEMVLYMSDAIIGSDFNHRKIYLDYRKFWSKNKHVFAFNGYSRLTFGNVPFDELSLLGGAKRMRGYYEGFYRDKLMGVVQGEYRFPLYKRFSGVAFTSFGMVTDKFSNIESEYIRPSGGVGLRFLLAPKDNLNIRVDYGIGRNTSGFYLTVGEAF